MSWKLDSWRKFDEMWEQASDYQKISYTLKKNQIDTYINRRNAISLISIWNDNESRNFNDKIINNKIYYSLISSTFLLILLLIFVSKVNIIIILSVIVLLFQICYLFKIQSDQIYSSSYVASVDLLRTFNNEERGIMSYLGKLYLNKLDLLHDYRYKVGRDDDPDYIEAYKYFIEFNISLLRTSIEDSSSITFHYY